MLKLFLCYIYFMLQLSFVIVRETNFGKKLVIFVTELDKNNTLYSNIPIKRVKKFKIQFSNNNSFRGWHKVNTFITPSSNDKPGTETDPAKKKENCRRTNSNC